jgi:hypothetical protein
MRPSSREFTGPYSTSALLLPAWCLFFCFSTCSPSYVCHTPCPNPTEPFHHGWDLHNQEPKTMLTLIASLPQEFVTDWKLTNILFPTPQEPGFHHFKV